MSETLKDMDVQVKEPAQAGENVEEAAVAARELSGAERALVGDLVRQARAEGGRVDRPGRAALRR